MSNINTQYRKPLPGTNLDYFDTQAAVEAIQPGETVHTAAAKLGLHIPKACGMGICGTCRVPLTAGQVEMEHNGGITDEDVATLGWHLAQLPRSGSLKIWKPRFSWALSWTRPRR